MLDPAVIIAATAFLGLCVTAFAMLSAWQGWLRLKQRELDSTPAEIEGGVGASAARIVSVLPSKSPTPMPMAAEMGISACQRRSSSRQSAARAGASVTSDSSARCRRWAGAPRA